MRKIARPGNTESHGAVADQGTIDTPYGRHVTSEGWFVLNLADALALRNEEKGGAL